MGTWGVKSFENDSALDWISELEDEKDLSLVIMKFFELYEEYNRCDNDLIESDLASEAIAAAEIVSALLGNPSNELTPNISKWLKKKSYDRDLVSIINAIIMNTEFEDDSKEIWRDSTKDEKWVSALDCLSGFANNSINIVLEKSELNELWQESNEYDKWLEAINELRSRCKRKKIV